MKILFDHPNPFIFAHGGFQIQIEQTKSSLEASGVEVEYLRWWDDQQRGDIIHYFGRPTPSYINLAQRKNIKIVMAPLLGGLGARSTFAQSLQRLTIRFFEAAIPERITMHFGWSSFRLADACIALTSVESRLMSEMFGASGKKIYTLPNGIEPVFLNDARAERGPWLVCTATINPIKRIVELCHAALQAQTPLWIIGRAYSNNDPYAQNFFSIAKENPSLIRYEGPISDREELARIYREARGFVLLSKWESLSLSALEAAGCRCPMLLSDLPWAKSVFKDRAMYCPISKSTDKTGVILRKFYDEAPRMPVPPKPKNWIEIGQQLKSIYEDLLKTSR